MGVNLLTLEDEYHLFTRNGNALWKIFQQANNLDTMHNDVLALHNS